MLTRTDPHQRSGVDRRRVLRQLTAVTRRTIEWRPFLTSATAGLCIVAVPAIAGVELTTANLVLLLRIAATCGALGIGFTLDDRAAASVETVPVSRLTRTAVRGIWAVIATLIWWSMILTIVQFITVGADHSAIPLAAMIIEPATIVGASLAVAAAGTRYTHSRAAPGNRPAGGAFASTAISALTIAAILLPKQSTPLVDPADPDWNIIHTGWALMLIACVAAFVITSHEPASGNRR